MFSMCTILSSSKKISSALSSIKPLNGVWELVSMDYHGPISPTFQGGNKYIMSY